MAMTPYRQNARPEKPERPEPKKLGLFGKIFHTHEWEIEVEGIDVGNQFREQILKTLRSFPGTMPSAHYWRLRPSDKRSTSYGYDPVQDVIIPYEAYVATWNNITKEHVSIRCSSCGEVAKHFGYDIEPPYAKSKTVGNIIFRNNHMRMLISIIFGTLSSDNASMHPAPGGDRAWRALDRMYNLERPALMLKFPTTESF